MNKQVLVSIAIGRYKDEILCDVVPMHASHVLLGRPWQFDRRAIHDGYRNRYTFFKDGRSVTLVPLTPSQVYEDQLRIKRSIGENSEKRESEHERKEREKREREEKRKEKEKRESEHERKEKANMREKKVE